MEVDQNKGWKTGAFSLTTNWINVKQNITSLLHLIGTVLVICLIPKVFKDSLMYRGPKQLYMAWAREPAQAKLCKYQGALNMSSDIVRILV